MKTSLQKLIVLTSVLMSSHLYSQCDLPQTWEGNTGSNMTVFFTAGAISALSTSSASPYLVALSPEGLLVGSASVASADLNNGQQSLAVWGDDTSTPETDGALAGDEITFQLVDGGSLYDLNLSFAGSNSYVTNGTLAVIGASAELNCSDSDSESNSQCDLPQPWEGNTGANMTVMFLEGAIASLSTSSDSPYIVALTDGMVVGSGSLASADLQNGQQQIAVWGDDTFSPEVDGALIGEEITFQLVDGSSLYDLNNLTFLNGSNVYESNSFAVILSLSSELINCSDSSNPGCTDPTAFNYDADANTDDGSCIAVVMGCMEPSAFNYNASANTDDGSCIPVIIGCTLDWADNYDENANTDDGSCSREGCMWAIADNYDLLATIDDGSCFKTGCMSEWADNYDIFATDDDGSCFIQLNEEEYQSLSESSQGSSDCEEIVIDIQEGWNIFGYTSSQVIEIGEVMAPYDDYIYIIKDNNGSQYWPANDYNGIGDFIPGGGYQIKAYESFSISF